MTLQPSRRAWLARLAALFCSTLGLCNVARAQFLPVGQFNGNASEGFEAHTPGAPAVPCLALGVFLGEGELCTESGSAGALVVTGWNFACNLGPFAGQQFFGGLSEPVVYSFPGGVTKFGGYFATNTPPAPNGTIEFYDGSGVLINSDSLAVPATCSWVWQGWDGGGSVASSVRISGGYATGGWMMMDDMQVELLPMTQGTAFCFCDGQAIFPPCGNAGIPGNGCANSSSPAGAHLDSTGFASLGAGTLALHGSGLAPLQPGLYFQGDNAVASGVGVLFGDGLRCAGGNVLRIEVISADASGSSNTTVDIAQAQLIPINPGDTRRYQLWYRDPFGSPCGAAFNLTNGLELTWLP